MFETEHEIDEEELPHANLPRVESTRRHTNICTSEHKTTAKRVVLTENVLFKYAWTNDTGAYCLRFPRRKPSS